MICAVPESGRRPRRAVSLLAKAAEYVFVSTQELQSESSNGKSVSKVSFKTYFLKTVKRMRAAYDICQPSGELGEEESALAQCFMAIAGFVRKMSGTSEVDTDAMNRHVAKMVEEALKYNKVESVLEDGEQEDIFSPEYYEKLSDVKMPASKLELNDKCKALAKKIKEIIDTKSSFADWLNNQIVRDQLKFDIKVCLIKNGYPPQYSPEVFRKVMEQVENFEENQQSE